MAAFSRSIPRALPGAFPPSLGSSTFRAFSRPSRNFPEQTLRANSRKFSSSRGPSASSSRSNTGFIAGASVVFAALAGGYVYTRQGKPEVHLKKGSAEQSIGLFKPTPEDYQKVYDAIAKLLWEKDEYDDGSYGPVLLRLAWHASGTYDAATGTGGSNGATMRFAPERDHGANSGLQNARDFLEPVKGQFPWISYSDLWTLGGVCAIQEMQGPTVPWRPGRQDQDESWCSPDGRLPDGTENHDKVRALFGRMGFNDQEMVALCGAHALGRCHTDRSGYDGPWTFSPTVLTNDFYRLLIEEKWHWRKWSGLRQYQDDKTKSLMMLPSDMALVQDPEFEKHVKRYAEDSDVFFKEFSDVIVKLFELGVPFKTNSEERLQLHTFEDDE